MSFDARSRERLEALGRTLPQKLPLPSARQAPASPAAAASQPRHRVEREEDPEALFHALMQASPDGSVPPHLLERLRSLEESRPLEATTSASTAGAASGGAAARSPASRPGPGERSRRVHSGERSGRTSSRAAAGDRDLYDAFDDLLRCEDDDVPASAPSAPRRQADERLLPRPTLRRERPG